MGRTDRREVAHSDMEEMLDRQRRRKLKFEVEDDLPEGVEEVKPSLDHDHPEGIQEREPSLGDELSKNSLKRKRNGAVDVQTEACNGGKEGVSFRKKKRKIDIDALKSLEIISFEQAKELIRLNPKCGLKLFRERKHIALPYHLIGGNALKSFEFISKMTIGKYRKQVKGVVVAIRDVVLAGPARVIDDQMAFHTDVLVTQAVFRPIYDEIYEARVTHISSDFIAALIMDVIAISAPIDAKFEEKLKGITLEIGDIVALKYHSITINRGMCQLKGSFVRIIRKKEFKHLDVLVKDNPDVVANSKNKRTTFVETDDESE